MRTDTLAASVVILIVATIIQRSIGFGRGVLFCRWLSPEMLGQWEMAYSFLLLFAPLAVLGIPGSYGRYLEHYRQRGQLRLFLRRTGIWTAICSAVAIIVLLVFAPQFSELVFGTDGSISSIYAVAACLAAVILHHTLTSLFTAMRLFRVVTIMNFLQSILFAVLTLALLFKHVSVLSIVGGYGFACLIASVWVDLVGLAGNHCSPGYADQCSARRVLVTVAAIRVVRVGHEFALAPVCRGRSGDDHPSERACSRYRVGTSRPLPQQPYRAAAAGLVCRPLERIDHAASESRLGTWPS